MNRYKKMDNKKENVKCKECIHSYPFDDNYYMCIAYGGWHSLDWSCERGEKIEWLTEKK